MRSISGMPSDEMAGDAERRVPVHYYTRWWTHGRGKQIFSIADHYTGPHFL